MVLSTTAAGTISQTARGFSNFLTRSASEEDPVARLLGHLIDRVGRHVEDDAIVAALQEAPHHIGAHPAEADHSELHG